MTARERSDLQKKVLELLNHFNTPQQKLEIKNVIEDLKKSTCERKNFETLGNLIVRLAVDESNAVETLPASSKPQQEYISCAFLDLVYICLVNKFFEKNHMDLIVRKILQFFSIQENFDAFPKYQMKKISANSMIRIIQMCFYFINFDLSDPVLLRLIILVVEVFASNEASLDSISRPLVIQMTEKLIVSFVERAKENSNKDLDKLLKTSQKNPESLYESDCEIILKSYEDLNSHSANILEDFKMKCLDIENFIQADGSSMIQKETKNKTDDFKALSCEVLFNWLYNAIFVKKMYFSSYIINTIVKHPVVLDIPELTSLLDHRFFDIIFDVLENANNLPKSTISLTFDSLIEINAKFKVDTAIENNFYLKLTRLELFNQKINDLVVEFIYNVLKIRSQNCFEAGSGHFILSNFDLLLIQTLQACIIVESVKIKEQIIKIIKLIRSLKEVSNKAIEIVFCHYNKNGSNIQDDLLLECLVTCVENDFRFLFNTGLGMAKENSLVEICIQFKKYMKDSWVIFFNRLFNDKESQSQGKTVDFEFLKNFRKNELIHFISGIHCGDQNVLVNEIFSNLNDTNSSSIYIFSRLLSKITSFDVFLDLVRKFYRMDENAICDHKIDSNEVRQPEISDAIENSIEILLSQNQEKKENTAVKDKKSFEHNKAPYIFGLIIKNYLDQKREPEDYVKNYKLLLSFIQDFFGLSSRLNVLTKVYKIFSLAEGFYPEKLRIIEIIQINFKGSFKENEIRLMLNICRNIVAGIQSSDEKEKLAEEVFENTIRGVYGNFLCIKDQKYVDIILMHIEEMIFSQEFMFFAILDIMVEFLFFGSLRKRVFVDPFLLKFMSKLFLIENFEKSLKILETFFKCFNETRIDPFLASMLIPTGFIYFLSKTVIKFQNHPSQKIPELAMECYKTLAQKLEIKNISEILVQEDKTQVGDLKPFLHSNDSSTKAVISTSLQKELNLNNSAHGLDQNELALVKAMESDLEINVSILLNSCKSQNLENLKQVTYLKTAGLILNQIFLKSFKAILSHSDSLYIITAVLNIIPIFYHSKEDLKDLSEVLKKILMLDKNGAIDCFVKTCGNSKDGSFCLQVLASWLTKDSKDTSLTLIDKISQGLTESSLETKDELDGLVYFIEYSIQFSQSNEFLEPVLRVISKSDYIKNYLSCGKRKKCDGTSKDCDRSVFTNFEDENSQDNVVFSQVFHKLNEFTYKFIIDQLSLPVTEKRENVILEYFTFYIDLLTRFDKGQESYGLFLAIVQSNTSYRRLKFKSYEVLFRFLAFVENNEALDQAYTENKSHRLEIGKNLMQIMIGEIRAKILYFSKKYLQEGYGTSMYLTVEMLYILKMTLKLQNVDMIRPIRSELSDLLIVKNNQMVDYVRRLFKCMFMSENSYKASK